MGLDQYLSVRKYISRIDWSKSTQDHQTETLEFRNVVTNAGLQDIVDGDGYVGAYVEVPVYYWRKANFVHQYIVDNYANGEDNCQAIELTIGALRELVDLCHEVLKDKSKASELLPTQSGFFFGSTEYDDWYYEQVEDTFRGLSGLLEKVEASSEELYPVYQASW
jgi:hypothetical protein